MRFLNDSLRSKKVEHSHSCYHHEAVLIYELKIVSDGYGYCYHFEKQ